MPKLISTVLTAAIVAVLAATGTVAAQDAQRFDDVPAGHYAYDAINWLVDEGITGGCGDGTNFCPDQPLTRAHIAAFLYRYHQAFGPPAVAAPLDCDSAIGQLQATVDDVAARVSGDATQALTRVATTLFSQVALNDYQRIHTAINELMATLTGPHLAAVEKACESARVRLVQREVQGLVDSWDAVRDVCRSTLSTYGVEC